MSSHFDNIIGEFYDNVQNIVDQTTKTGIQFEEIGILNLATAHEPTAMHVMDSCATMQCVNEGCSS